MGRSRTEDHDKRTRNVRPRESREGSASTVPAAVPSLPPLPITISEPATMITSIIEDLFVQDIDAEEGSGEKDKEEFKEDCLKLIMEHLFDGAGLAERILHALGEYPLRVSRADLTLSRGGIDPRGPTSQPTVGCLEIRCRGHSSIVHKGFPN